MASVNVCIGIIFLGQIFIGTLGNLSLLGKYLFLYFRGYKTRAIDLILVHLTVANLLVILSRGIPETMAAYGLEDFLSDFGCKCVFYASRVGRGVAFGSTCLLSVFQAVTISPSYFRWAKLKVKAPKYISTFTVLCWVLHLALNTSFSLTLTSKLKTRNITNKIDFAYCSDPRTTKGIYTGHAVCTAIADVLCMAVMLLASGSMLFILFMHKKRILHMHRTRGSSGFSFETRATHTILIVMGIFVFFYFLSSVMQIYVTFLGRSIILLFSLTSFTSACFSTVCPFVFMTVASM